MCHGVTEMNTGERSPSSRRGQALGFCLLVALLTAPFHALADTSPRDHTSDLAHLGLEDLMQIEIATVKSASKFEQKVTEAPSSVSIITAADIKYYGYRTLADILKSVRGFYVTYDRNYHYIGIRGFGRPGDYNTRILLLVDGHRINDNIFDQAPIGTDFILDTDLIDRVEIIRGPGSSIYGSNAFFGTINVITKRGRDMKGMEASGEIGRSAAYKSRVSYGTRFGRDAETIISGSLYDTKGRDLYFREFDNPASNNGMAMNADSDRYRSLFSNTRVHDFSLQGAYISREKGIPTAPWGTIFNDPRTHTTDERGYLDLKYERALSDWMGIAARLFYDHYRYGGDYVYDIPPVVTLNRDSARGEWRGGEIRITGKLPEKHTWIAGAEFQDNFHQEQHNFDEAPYRENLHDIRKSQTAAAYIQDEFIVSERLILNAGIRYDHFSTFGESVSPRLALIYKPFEMTALKLIYGEAFRAPNIYELYAKDDVTTKSNPNLSPETIKTYEVALEHYFPNNVYATFSLFLYRIKNLITQETDPADGLLVFNNVDRVRAKGVEVEVGHKWPIGVEGRISQTYVETRDTETGQILTNSPRNLSKLNLLVPVIKGKFFAGAEAQYTGSRKTLSGNEVDYSLVANLNLLSKNIIRDLEVSGSIYNLFNTKYSDPGAGEHVQDSLRQDGRGVRFKVVYKF